MDNALLWNHRLLFRIAWAVNAEFKRFCGDFTITTNRKWGENVNGKEQDTSGKCRQEYPNELLQEKRSSGYA